MFTITTFIMSTVVHYCIQPVYKVALYHFYVQGLRRKFHERDHTGSVRAIATGGHYLATGGSDEAIKYGGLCTSDYCNTSSRHL